MERLAIKTGHTPFKVSIIVFSFFILLTITMEDLSDSPLCERKIKRSLIISPNLDALLEHEEKTRARISSIVSEMTTSSFSSRSVSPSEEFPVGLPPPPRHLQRLKSSRATVKGLLLPLEDTEPQARETVAKHAPISVSVPATSSSTSNPYINPAPTLAELIVDIPPDYQSRLPSGPRDSSPIIFTSPWSSVGEDESRPSASRVLRRPYDVPRQICGDRQRQSDTDNKPWQRPLNTHAKRPSTSPAFTHPFSSHEPSNTEECEPRISISSTIYPPSDSHSHSPSFYNDSVFSLAKQDRMEIYPLSQKTEFNLDSTSIDCPQLSPIQFSKLSVSFDRSSPRSSKPVLPATPKPVFNRGPGISRQLYPFQTERLKTNETALPTTTNFLDSEARADLVRKTRKLARVFGQTPVVDTTPAQEPSLMSRCSSVLNDLDWPILRRRRSAFQSESEPSLLNGVRRHSMPLSPVDIPFMTNVSPTYQGYLSPSNDQAGYHAQVHIGPANPSVDTGGVTAAVMSKAGRSSNCTSVQSLEKMSEEDQVVEYRKRKREKLAKLHRFLGSRVPVNLVLGIDDAEASLPPPCLSPTSLESADSQKTWLKRRKSSSAILSSPHWHNNLERVKEELNNKEKLINVRRAVKMEKVCFFLSVHLISLVTTIHSGFWCCPASNSLSYSLLLTSFVTGKQLGT